VVRLDLPFFLTMMMKVLLVVCFLLDE
jgi:hypothetical protein